MKEIVTTIHIPGLDQRDGKGAPDKVGPVVSLEVWADSENGPETDEAVCHKCGWVKDHAETCPYGPNRQA